MTIHKTLLPESWVRPKGYANGMSARGRIVLTGGLVGWNHEGIFEAKDLVGQFRQLIANTLAVLAVDGAGPEHIVRMTWYVVDRDEYVDNLPGIGAVYRELIGKNFPAMAVVQVVALVEQEARIEIETTAIVPE